MSQSSYKAYYKPGFQRKAPYAKYQAMSRNNYRQRISQKQVYVPKPVYTSKERKYSDTAVAGHQVCTSGNFSLLHSPYLGSDYFNRVGRKTLAKSIYVRGKVDIVKSQTPASGNVGGGLVRFILLVDNQPNGALPNTTDLLMSASPSAMLNPNNRDRFTILKDKEYVLDPYAVDLVGAFVGESWNRTIHAVKAYKKCNIETIFNSLDDGDITTINTGAIYMFWIGSWAFEADEENWKVAANVSTRVRYDDN